MRGWAFGIIDRRINVCAGSEGRRRVDDVVLMYDDNCKVSKSNGFITPSSIIHDTDEYVVYVTRDGPPDTDYQYRIHWVDRRMNFGGAAPAATLEEATEIYNRVRGAEHHQPSLF